MSELHRRQPRGMGEKCKPWTAEEETTWDALGARLNRDHPGRIHGFKTPEEEEAAWDDMNESIDRDFPGLRKAWFDRIWRRIVESRQRPNSAFIDHAIPRYNPDHPLAGGSSHVRRVVSISRR